MSYWRFDKEVPGRDRFETFTLNNLSSSFSSSLTIVIKGIHKWEKVCLITNSLIA